MTIQATGLLLDGCVLSLISREDAYGYNLTQQLKAAIGVSESTLYPVMRRLQTEGCLATYDVSHNGRNRRYYTITEKGREKHAYCTTQWANFSKQISTIMMEGQYD